MPLTCTIRPRQWRICIPKRVDKFPSSFDAQVQRWRSGLKVVSIHALYATQRVGTKIRDGERTIFWRWVNWTRFPCKFLICEILKIRFLCPGNGHNYDTKEKTANDEFHGWQTEHHRRVVQLHGRKSRKLYAFTGRLFQFNLAKGIKSRLKQLPYLFNTFACTAVCDIACIK